MSKILSNKSEIHKILVVSLTNIGDVVLTFPVIDILMNDFPAAKISVVIGPKAKSLFNGNPNIDRVHIFDKHQSGMTSIVWIRQLRREHFDLAVDLRNTAIPILIGAKYRTPVRTKKRRGLHMKDKHIDRLKSIYPFEQKQVQPNTLIIPRNVENLIGETVEKTFGRIKKFIVVAPGAADQSKRWAAENFAYICDRLIKQYGLGVVFAGSQEDNPFAQKIISGMRGDALNMCGRTDLIQLAELMNHCAFALVNDSAPMHIASYLNVPVLALFGPTNPHLYGPWGEQSWFLWKNESCDACKSPKRSMTHTCMAAITPDDVLGVLKDNFLDHPSAMTNEL